MPVTHGPAEQPRSPNAAKSPNISAPPVTKRAADILRVPGHITLTEKPQIAQNMSDTIALGDSAITI